MPLHSSSDCLSAELTSPRSFALGLIVGKFSPLHLGHEFLINQAARHCDRLLILSYSKPEFANCAAAERRRWLNSRFPQHEAIVLDQPSLRDRCAALAIPSRPLPENDASDETQQRFLAWLLAVVLQRQPDALFGSESYGVGCASVLSTALGRTVTPIIVDLHRHRFPVSATQIRQDPHSQRQWLSPEVRASFVSRIAILGGESSGKTTLAAWLAAHFKTACAHEYGRELWEQQSGKLTEPDLLKIAHSQIRREEALSQVANRYLFCDTSPLTTAGYGLWMFGRVQPELAELATREYAAAILCKPDFPFVQDGTRREKTFRDQQHAWYQGKSAELKYPVLEVGGDPGQRVWSVAGWLERQNLR